MILEYCEKAIEKAEYKKLEDGTWFAEKNIICLSPFSLLLYLFWFDYFTAKMLLEKKDTSDIPGVEDSLIC